MSDHPILFGFGTPDKKAEEYPLKFLEHCLIGGNPKDQEHGYSDTEEEALIQFAKGFQELAKDAEHKFLFVRRAPFLTKHNSFEGKTQYRMIGRFSIAELKEDT